MTLGSLPSRALLAAAFALLATHPGDARADGGTIWARSRHPEAERRRELVLEAESLERKALLHAHRRGPRDELLLNSDRVRAVILLREAGAATSSDLSLRFRLASLHGQLKQWDKAVPLLESIVRANPPAPLRAAALADLGVAYSEVRRIEEAIAAYTEALRIQPIAHERARLLQNRAEGYMQLGDTSAAITGYRAGLALLSADYMLGSNAGSTMLWGLGVALDRTGDLDSGLDSIRIARIYDQEDRGLNSESWSYVPPYDQHWYEALGHWQVARKPDVLTSVRVHAYARALSSWDEWVQNAAAHDDKWLPLAKVRLKQCEKERAAFLRLPGTGVGGPPRPALTPPPKMPPKPIDP
jgi:tetratricopeptide (TPR) repeat protein